MSVEHSPTISWQHNGTEHQARWISEAGLPAPKQIVIADDTLAADAAFRLIREGNALLWQGDYQNARNLLQALARRADKTPRRGSQPTPSTAAEAFAEHRLKQGRRANILGNLLIPLTADYRIPLRRGQDVVEACIAGLGPAQSEAGGAVISLRGLLSLVSAYEWRKKGAFVPALNARIHPHFGVFSPVRGEYVDLVAKASLPNPCQLAFDIGVGSGVLTCVLAQRGIPKVIGTDLDPRALVCARENIQRLGLSDQAEVQSADLFPNSDAKADLVICNPPWLPATPTSPVEAAVYDPNSQMLRGFLAGAASRLSSTGEAWLIISDIAEHLTLRHREELLGWIKAGGLCVVDRMDAKPNHPKTRNQTDALHKARAKEITSLWRLKKC
jgi:methylase of polypeptide subunit release factors